MVHAWWPSSRGRDTNTTGGYPENANSWLASADTITGISTYATNAENLVRKHAVASARYRHMGHMRVDRKA